MPEVGVKGLRTCHGQKDGAEGKHADNPVRSQEREAVGRIKGRKHPWVGKHVNGTGRANNQKPCGHYRAEQCGDLRRSVTLDREQPDENDDGDGHDVGLEQGSDQLQPFDGRKTDIAGVMRASPKNSAAPAPRPARAPQRICRRAHCLPAQAEPTCRPRRDCRHIEARQRT